MKRGLWPVLGMGLWIVLGACGKGEAAPPQNAEVTVRLLTDDSGIDDKSFNAAAWRGILEFYGDTWENPKGRGIHYDVITAQTQDMYVPNIRQATDEQYDLIVTTGFTFAEALEEVAAENQDQKYLIVDVSSLNLPNVMQAVFAEHEGSYLVGVAAALKAQADGIVDPRFGFIGGIPDATITKFEVGYIQGILSVIPGARIAEYYVGDWNRPDMAKSQAKNWYDSGVYIIYSAAGNSGNGTIAQAKEYRTQGRNVWAIGVDSDQYEEGLLLNSGESAVLTSMLKMVETAILYGLNAVKSGGFKGEVITFDMEVGGVGYSTKNAALTSGIAARLEEIKQRIISGEIKIAKTYAEAKKLPGFPQNLNATDN
ncbi:MAG: BMP family ABC transporter substrate-binding protein [Treponema sp.]|nr:BMP family ABC transporter substrate-binding protein [Treponema sp.]